MIAAGEHGNSVGQIPGASSALAKIRFEATGQISARRIRSLPNLFRNQCKHDTRSLSFSCPITILCRSLQGF